MSIYGSILFERAHEKVLNGIKYQDDNDIFLDWDFPIRDLKYLITLYNKGNNSLIKTLVKSPMLSTQREKQLVL